MTKEYFVSIPITGRLEVKVKADTEEEALKKAIRKASSDIDGYLEQVAFLEKDSSVFDEEDLR